MEQGSAKLRVVTWVSALHSCCNKLFSAYFLQRAELLKLQVVLAEYQRLAEPP